MSDTFKQRLVMIFLAFLAIASFVRMFDVRDVYWDDNCWLLARYARSGLTEFLDDGFSQMRRAPLGVFYYLYFGIHRLSDQPFLYWNTIALLIQMLSTWMVYALVRTLLPKLMLPALVAAVAYVALPLDHTMPYVSGTNYRLGFLLALCSCWLSLRAVLGGRPRLYLLLAVILALFNTIVLTETALPLEVVRLVMIAWVLPVTQSWVTRLRALVGYALLFGFPHLPYVWYRLTFKPYGMYQSVYQHNLGDVFNWHSYYELMQNVPFGLWRHLLSAPNLNPGIVMPLALLAGVGAFLIIRNLMASEGEQASAGHRKAAFFLLLLGLIVILCQQGLLVFAGREFRWGPDSTHGIFIQLGTSLIVSSFSLLLCSKYGNSKLQVFITRLLFPVILAAVALLGVHYNNKNLSLLINESQKQERFWMAFMERFPVLPPRATFIFDIYVDSFHDASDLDTGYDIDAWLNLLYAKNGEEGGFYRYTAMAPEEMRMRRLDFSKLRLGVSTRFGLMDLEAGKTIPIAYRDGVIYAGDEIRGLLPPVPYVEWLAPVARAESQVVEFQYRAKIFPGN